MTRSSSQSLGVLLAGCLLLVAGIPSIATAFSSNPIDGWEQTAKIEPDDADEPGPLGHPAHAFTRFGASTAFDGGTLVVGTATDSKGPNLVTYVFHRTEAGEWEQTTKLAPQSGLEKLNGFGAAVAVDEDAGTIVVADPGYDRDDEEDAGAVYVFEQTPEGDWVQTRRFLYPGPATQTQPGPYFGRAVAIEGDTIMIGTPLAFVEGEQFAGKVYTYDRTDQGWVRSTTLVSSNVAERTFFGRALAVDDGRLAVGASGETVGGLIEVGAVYIFAKEEGTWERQDRITPPDPGRTGPGSNCFAFSVDIVGKTVISGDPCWQYAETSPVYISKTTFAGSAYVYEETRRGWMLDAQLSGSHASQSDFGAAVAIDDSEDQLVVGARDGPFRHSGAAYIFQNDGSNWQKELVLANDTGPGDQFGRSVAMSEGTAVAGAPFDDNRRDGTPWPLNDQPDIRGLGTTQGKDAGSVYIFEDRGGFQALGQLG